MWNGLAEGGEAIHGYTDSRRLSEIALAYHVACLRPDIALSASPFEGDTNKAVPLAPNDISGIPVASIFYDAIPYRYPKQYLRSARARKFYNRRLLNYSKFDLNLCISEFSRSECVDLTGNPRSVNILAGVSQSFTEALNHNREEIKVASKRSILYVGGLDWRKNVAAAIAAFAQLPNEIREQFCFVLAGHSPNSAQRELKAKWKQLGLPGEDLVTVGHVSDSDLVSLYKGADLVIQPSLSEGFGLTALEAMTCGVPVIASNAGALPEIVEDKAFLFDPTDTADITRAMKHALGKSDAAKDATTRQRIKAAEFSWSKSAAVAVDALRKTVSSTSLNNSPKNAADTTKAVLENVEKLSLPKHLVADALARAEQSTNTERRLIVDATATYNVDHKTGIQRVVKNICANIGSKSNSTEDSAECLIASCDANIGWFPVDRSLEKRTSEALSNISLEFTSNDRILLLDSSWDIYQSEYKALRTARLRGAAIISCLYDTVPLMYPAMCHAGMPPFFSSWFQKALQYSTGFVCISKAVADELIAILHAIEFPRELKVGYWHLGADFGPLPTGKTAVPRATNPAPTFLMVGTLEPRKGYQVALDAFDRLWDAGLDIRLTIVGRPGWGVDNLVERIQNHSEYGSRLLWFNGISDGELQENYARSDALVAASYAEGFGLPIVEARHFGKPVIASDIPVFREVAERGQNCDFFAVGSAESLADAIRSFLTEGVKRKNSLEGSWMSWKESAEELQKLVLSENWYQTYRPKSARAYASITDIGKTKMTTALSPDEARHKIDLIEGPIATDGGRILKYVLRVTNLSNRLWSSGGERNGAFSIMAGYRVVTGNGQTISSENPLFPMPFVLPPGKSIYLSISIPADVKRSSGKYADLGLFQKSVGWLSGELRVPL
nr:glycosyltransferase family 1 protein [Rhizobium cauense]